MNNYDKIKNTLEILVPELIEAIQYEANFLTSTSVIKSEPSAVFPNQECIGFCPNGYIAAIGRTYYASTIAFIRIKPDGTIIN